ncbi:hypothetical protein HNR42_002342 [Deinobacterium chartae]|uniref:PEGA domain-containing protein n=1 Tax=Deinobacterium chartae TaxID=521158 RepID=A0A841HZT3_9DEIO|nr:hypothetical protein [Deinobacterium chartae]MBB6098907.1 hypothetical protein [Deinobacterium chartae]
MKRTVLAVLLAVSLLSGCIPGLTRDYNVTVSNRACLTNATVFIDGQLVGVIPGGGVSTFRVSPGSHDFNVDNDLIGPQVVRVDRDLEWRGGTCL